MLGLGVDFHQFRGTRLHPIRHLEGVDPGSDLRVACLVEPHAVERGDGVERVALEMIVNTVGVGEVEDGLAPGAKLDALIHGRQEAAPPVGVAAARTL